MQYDAFILRCILPVVPYNVCEYRICDSWKEMYALILEYTIHLPFKIKYICLSLRYPTCLLSSMVKLVPWIYHRTSLICLVLRNIACFSVLLEIFVHMFPVDENENLDQSSVTESERKYKNNFMVWVPGNFSDTTTVCDGEWLMNV